MLAFERLDSNPIVSHSVEPISLGCGHTRFNRSNFQDGSAVVEDSQDGATRCEWASLGVVDASGSVEAG